MKKGPVRRPPRKLARRNLSLDQIQGRAEDIRRAYFQIFSSEEGRLALEDMEARYDVWKGTLRFVPGRPVDPLLLAWCEGRRQVVLDLYQFIEDGREGRLPAPQVALTEETAG